MAAPASATRGCCSRHWPDHNTSFVYEKPSLFDLAAAYAHGIIKNHPFIDGNKRSGFLAAALFLEANGIRFNGSERDAVIQTIALAAGESTLQDFSAWLERATITPPAE